MKQQQQAASCWEIQRSSSHQFGRAGLQRSLTGMAGAGLQGSYFFGI